MGHEKRMGVPLKKGTERDALTGWRKLLTFRPGERAFAKKVFNRRVRHRPIGGEDSENIEA